MSSDSNKHARHANTTESKFVEFQIILALLVQMHALIDAAIIFSRSYPDTSDLLKLIT